MKIPSSEQFSRIFAHVERIDQLPASQIPIALKELAEKGEPEDLLSYLRLNYALPSPPEFELKPGDRIADHYTIQDKIGAGGMGIVYRATQDRTERDVALKLIHPRLHSRAHLERFQTEIVTLGKLDHPGIVHLFDADTHDGTIFFAMQLLDGDPLHQYLRKNVLSRHQQLNLIIELCDAVQAAHDRDVIHRDLKPGNIYIDRATGKPIVLDFGLATLAGQLIAQKDKQISGLSGTPNYMSPEQFLGTAGEFRAGQSIDVYALGVIAFEILASHSPYEFPSDCSWSDKRKIVLEDSPSHLADHPKLDKAVRKAIRKNPAHRYFTASGFAKALRRIQREITSAEGLRSNSWSPHEGATIPSTDWVLEKDLKKYFCEGPREIPPNTSQLAKSLTKLTQRRSSEQQIAKDASELERRAYCRGVVRTATIAVFLITIISTLGVFAFFQNKNTQYANSTTFLRLAISLPESLGETGFPEKGHETLVSAPIFLDDLTQIHSAVSALLTQNGLKVSTQPLPQASTPSSDIALSSNESWQYVSCESLLKEAAIQENELSGSTKPTR